MDNRFGFKDFVLTVLLVAILVSIWLAMKQFDRQWDAVQTLHHDIRSLTNTQNQTLDRLLGLHRALTRGEFTVSSEAGSASEEVADSFDGIRAARAKPDFAEGDVLVDVFSTNIKSVTALTYADLYGRRIQAFVLEGLITQDDETLEWKPHIARSWEIEDNGEAWEDYIEDKRAELATRADEDPAVYQAQVEALLDAMVAEDKSPPDPDTDAYADVVAQARQQWIDEQIRNDPDRPPAMTITFELRRDVRFSDGVPLTAHDVEFSWQLMNNPLVDAPQTRNFYDNVETYEAIDDYTVRFTFREPHYLGFSMVGGFSVLPKHFYESISVDELNSNPGLLLGSGPYRLEDPKGWAPNKLMKLVRNENYWGPKPAPAALIWREIENDVPRLNAFKNGEIDIFGATPEQYEDLREDPKTIEGYHAFEYKPIPSGYSFVAWNTRRNDDPTMFADRRVRQAMTYLIPRQRIAEQVLRGFAEPTAGPFDEGSRQADPNLTPRRFDPDRALSLLAEVGWTPGPDGVLRNQAGEPFKFTLTYPSGNDTYEQTMLMIKDTLNEHGILMTQDPQEWSVFIERVDARAFDACALAWGGGAIEADIRQMFHSSQIAGGANNFTSYANPELDALIDEARRTIDEDQRMELWQACHRILYEDQPYTFMHRRKSLVFIDKRIHNVKRVTTGLNDRTEWYVPMPLQARRP